MPPVAGPMETARGCWWGAKHHCTFCGLNQNDMAFRAKSPEQAMDELVHLVSRYGLTKVVFADNIISMDYFRTFLPELKRRHMGIQLLYETKANLNKEQVKLCAEAGVSVIQPGIESLSTNVLHLMHKGVSPLQNVQLLKWCREYGVLPYWNVLYGFPGETAADYDEMCRIAENLSHLTPPLCGGAIRVERFSPYFDYAADFGIRNLRAHTSYQYIYPFDESVRYDLAYFAQTLPQIIKDVRGMLNGSMPPEAWIGDFVPYLIDCRLLLEHEGRYLSLILSQPSTLAISR
jgi:ribosomal peptide maturation radical SAM protein 1